MPNPQRRPPPIWRYDHVIILAGGAPANPIVITPGVGSLILTGFAPTVSTPSTVTPPVVALILTGFVPSLTIGINVQPANATLVLIGFAPTVSTPSTVTPGVVALVLTGFAPTLAIGVYVTPAAGALTLTGFAPTLIIPQTITPASLALVLTGFAPSLGGPAVSPTAMGGTLPYRRIRIQQSAPEPRPTRPIPVEIWVINPKRFIPESLTLRLVGVPPRVMVTTGDPDALVTLFAVGAINDEELAGLLLD